MTDRPHVSRSEAYLAVGRSVIVTARLLLSGRIRQPRRNIGRILAFGDGSHGRIYRETVLDNGGVASPTVLVVEFRLRAVHGWLHRLFRWESLCNTPLFAGFPGLVSKLWLAHDENELYRGIYQWDGPERAAEYAEALRWILGLVCVPGSIEYQVVPACRRREFVAGVREFGVRPAAQVVAHDRIARSAGVIEKGEQ